MREDTSYNNFLRSYEDMSIKFAETYILFDKTSLNLNYDLRIINYQTKKNIFFLCSHNQLPQPTDKKKNYAIIILANHVSDAML